MNQMGATAQNNFMNDKHQVRSALRDLKDNYKFIEREIEETTKKQREMQHNRYQVVMERIESLKQSLKTEVNNRKETEEQFMTIVDQRSKDIQTALNLEYLNNIYKMKEKLANFEHRKIALQSKLVALSASIDKKLSHNKTNMVERIDRQKKKFEDTFREQVDADVKELKQMGELEYNFNNMIIDTKADR